VSTSILQLLCIWTDIDVVALTHTNNKAVYHLDAFRMIFKRVLLIIVVLFILIRSTMECKKLDVFRIYFKFKEFIKSWSLRD